MPRPRFGCGVSISRCMWLPIKQYARQFQDIRPHRPRQQGEVPPAVHLVAEELLAHSAARVHVMDAAGELGAR